MKQVSTDEEHETEERRSAWRRLKEAFFGREEPEEDVTATVQPPLRLQTVHSPTINLRLNIEGLDDARVAANGLKRGVYQIINVEHATPQSAQQIIDFLSGTCYALDGKVERLGDSVYMFVPCNVIIEVEKESTTTNTIRRTFGDMS